MKKDLVSTVFWLFFGIYFTFESYRFGLGEWSKPGPGYFPFGAGILFTILSLSVFLKTLRKPPPYKEPGQARSAERFHWQNIVLIITGMVAYALLLKRLGFGLCTFGLVVLFIRMIGGKAWFASVVTGLLVAVTFHVLFNMLLNVQLPNGILGFLD
jgi:hypothetical protein